MTRMWFKLDTAENSLRSDIARNVGESCYLLHEACMCWWFSKCRSTLALNFSRNSYKHFVLERFRKASMPCKPLFLVLFWLLLAAALRFLGCTACGVF